ncbi:MFS transporter [Micromonospora sp. NPDC047134]|uniref:MFS transporter n=1 Tax=Micromonospora sp. NPDC047134 TaxID=3154340 RepID=UPI0033C380D1
MTGTAPGVIESFRATPRSVRYLLAGVFVNQLGAFVQMFLVLYLVHRGLSVNQAGLSLSVFGIGAVAGTVLGGELTHRLGSRATIAVTMVGSALLIGLMPWVSTPGRYPALLTVTALAGMATLAYRPAAAAMLSDLMPEQHRVMAFSMMRIAMNAGTAVSPLLAAAAIAVNWHLLFWINSLTALAYAVLAITLLPGRSRPAERPDSAEGASAPAAGYLTMLRDTRFLVYLAAMLLSSMIYAQFTAVLPLSLAAAGHPAVIYSAVLTLASVILITCELKVTTVVRRWPPGIAGGLGTLLFAGGIAGYGLPGGSLTLVGICTFALVAGMMISGPTMFAHAATAPAPVKGRYIGVAQTMYGLGFALGPAVGLLAWNRIGVGVWLLCAVTGVFSAACAAIGVRRPFSATAEQPKVDSALSGPPRSVRGVVLKRRW